MNVVLTRSLPGEAETRLVPHFHKVVVFDQPRPATADELRRLVPEAEVLIVTVADRVDDAVLAAAPRLRCLITFSVGLDHVDTAAVARRGLPLVHTPDVLTDATADLAFALILGCARRLKGALRYVEEGRWAGFDPSLFLGRELRGSALGVVGMGKIGRAVAQRGNAFGMEILYAGPAKPSLPVEAKHLPLERLLATADVVTLHCPLKPETRHLLSTRELGVMKKNAILVNTARGPIVDEAALTAHLRMNPEFSAGLDVFEEEPRIAPGLVGLPNALCVPHIGSATTRARGAMAEVCVEEAIRFAQGEPLKHQWKERP